MLEIDNSTLEGGGQILRTAVSLAAIYKIPCRVFNIRQTRERPGLMHQHLLGIQSLANLFNGKLEGDSLNSKEIKFFPGTGYKENLLINIPTAASITLLLQTLIIPCLLIPEEKKPPINIKLKGGATDTFFSPTWDYFNFVFLRILEKAGMKIDIKLLKKGYYPEGGAEVEINIFPSKIKPFNLQERGCLKKIYIFSGASQSLKEKKVAERQIIGAREILGKLKLPLEEKIEYYQTPCPGSQICLAADFEKTIIGTDNLGKIGKRSEEVGKEAALELLKEQKTKACLDKHSADQILPFMALSDKKSQITVSEITKHCQTNIWTIEKFNKGKFNIKENIISWNPSLQSFI